MKKMTMTMASPMNYQVLKFREISFGERGDAWEQSSPVNGWITYTSLSENGGSMKVSFDDLLLGSPTFHFEEKGVKVYVYGNTVHIPCVIA